MYMPIGRLSIRIILTALPRRLHRAGRVVHCRRVKKTGRPARPWLLRWPSWRLYIAAAFVLLVAFENDVDQRGFLGGEGALERGLDLAGLLDQLTVPAHGRDNLVVARVVQVNRNVLAIEGALRPHHLAPGSVVADDADDGQVEADGRVEFEAVEAE